MMRLALFGMVLAGVLAGPPAFADENFSYVLREGSLDALGETGKLRYARAVELPADPALAQRENGEIVLWGAPDDMVMAQFLKGEGKRKMGAFPRSVGSPLFMLFIETVIRDMAGLTGGSPFYIRNRLKHTLTLPATVETRTVPFGDAMVEVNSVVLRPFAEDPNRQRMQGFEDLEVRVSTSDAVPGWYLTLEARAATEAGLTYRRALQLMPEADQ